MRQKTINISTTANQDIIPVIAAALKDASGSNTPLIGPNQDVSKVNLDIRLLFDQDYSGNITATTEGDTWVSKAEAKIRYAITGRIDNLVIELNATAVEVTVFL